MSQRLAILSMGAMAVLISATLSLGGALAAGGSGGGGGGGGGGGSSGGGGGSSGGGSGGGGNSSGGSSAREDLTTCSKGFVWSTKRRRCLRTQGGVLPDAELTEYAYALAKADRFAEAIGVLDLLSNPRTVRALNYRGYATRKLGRTEEGIGYYLQSVAMDPSYAQVREYLGEAYVAQGKMTEAKEQLRTIEKICGTTCEEYQDLANLIEGRAS